MPELSTPGQPDTGIGNTGRDQSVGTFAYGKIATPVHKAHHGPRTPLPPSSGERNLIGA